MAIPQIAIAAAPYAASIALTGVRFLAAGFGLIAGFALADKAFGFTAKSMATSKELADALAASMVTHADATAMPMPAPMSNGLDHTPAPAH